MFERLANVAQLPRNLKIAGGGTARSLSPTRATAVGISPKSHRHATCSLDAILLHGSVAPFSGLSP